MVIRFTKFFIFSLLISLSFAATGQVSWEKFGKNRLQFKNFDWRFYSSDNFEIYFYDNGQETARMTASFLEDEFDKITDILGYAPYSKTKIFLYNSVLDLHQSNVGMSDINYTINGQTNFVKLQVEIAYPGTMDGFRKELMYELSRVLIDDMMFGGSLADMFQSAYLMNLPEWFLNGAASYIAGGWTIEMDDYTRDLLKNNKVRNLKKVSRKDSRLIGHSIWNFIAEKYGRNNISNILNLTRIIRNEETSISSSLGVPFKQFLVEWKEYYNNMNTRLDNYVVPSDENKLRNKNRKNYVYNNVRYSPDGRYIAYSENYQGRYEVIIKDLQRGRKKTVLKSGNKLIRQKMNEDVPLLSWQNEGTLGVITTRYGSNFLYLVDARSGKKQKKELDKFSQIKHLAFSENGKMAVVSADQKGQNDLFVISLTRNAMKRLTNDIYDDIQPEFVPGTTAIVFSSNRVSDTLNVKVDDKKILSEISTNYNIFLYDVDTTTEVLKRVTNTISADYHPVPKDANTVFFLSDQKGIINLFKYDINSNLYTQVTNYLYSIQDFDVDPNKNSLSFIMLNDGREYVYHMPDFNLQQNIFTPQTMGQDVKQAKFISNRLRNRKEPLQQQAPQQPVQQDTAGTHVPQIPTVSDSIPPVEQPTDTLTDIIDTDNYVFDKVLVKKSEESTSFLANYRKQQTESKIIGPVPYETRFSADNLITSWVIDPLRDFGIQVQAQMNDMLEDHRFSAGLVAFTNLRNGTFYAEYEYFKKYVDFNVKYFRDAISQYPGNAVPYYKYVLNKYEVGASIPFNQTSRISFKPFFATTQSIDLRQSVLKYHYTPPANPDIPIDKTRSYLGGRVEFVFDNTLVNGLSSYEGTKANAFIEVYEGINGSSNSFNKIGVDVRHYLKIHRELTLAARGYYGRFFGNSPKKFLLGGMDNRLFGNSDINRNAPLQIEEDVDNSDILFTEFVTNMRGFNFNKLNGSNSVLLNLELRLPIIRYLYNGPIASNFFRNLQFVGFYDIGSAWTGNNPFAEENSVNTETIKNGNFQAKIKNFKNPWLSGYGCGVRTALLGYYLKFDVAWPVEDYEVKDPKFYVTLGYDF